MSKIIQIVKDSPISKLISPPSTNVDELFRMIKNDQVNDVADIYTQVYGADVSKVSVYGLLKRLQNKFIDAFICHPECGSHQQEVYAKLVKVNAAASILNRTDKKKEATFFAEKALKDALLYEFTDIVLSLSDICKNYYAGVGDAKKYNYYYELSSNTLDLHRAEKQAEDLYTQMVFNQSKKKSVVEDDHKLIANIFEQLSEIKKNHSNNRIQLIWGIAGIVLAQYEKDRLKSIQTCKDCLNFFMPQQSLVASSYIATFLFHLTPDLVKEGRVEEALTYLHRCVELTAHQSHNAVVVQQYIFIAAMHEEKFAEAKKSIEVRKELSLSEQQKETLHIHEAYYLLLTNESIRLGKLLNEVPIFNQDKDGMNLNIMFIQLLTFIRDGRYNAFIDRTPGVIRYINRHLKRTTDKRSKYFLKLLVELEHISFDKSKLSRLKNLPKLESHSYSESLKNFEIEIVPYEKLWQQAKAWL
jgi:hypothetical protein